MREIVNAYILCTNEVYEGYWAMTSDLQCNNNSIEGANGAQCITRGWAGKK